MLLDGKLVLITGASRGMGEATAKAIAKKGGRVILVARSEEGLTRVANAIRESGGKADYFSVDLSVPSAIADLARNVIEKIGTPDVLINNAGAGRWLMVQETTAPELEKMMALPYFAAFNLTRELLGSMQKRGSGHIINVTSPAYSLTWPGATGYIAARAALAAFNDALAMETRAHGISVTLATFGKVTSSYWKNNPGSEDRIPKIDSYLPTLSTDDVAHTLVRAIEKNQKTVVSPRILALFLFLKRLTPKIVDYISRWGWKEPL